MDLRGVMETKTIWRNYAVCEHCGAEGAYCFPANKVCYQCWSVDANRRSYTGSIQSDPKWLGAKILPSNKITLASLSQHVSSVPHLILDLLVVLILLFSVIYQEQRIIRLQDDLNNLRRGTVILLREYLERDQ